MSGSLFCFPYEGSIAFATVQQAALDVTEQRKPETKITAAVWKLCVEVREVQSRQAII